MKQKIVRIKRLIEGQQENKVYIETTKGYIPVFILLEQTENFNITEKEEIGEIEIKAGNPWNINMEKIR